MIVNAGKTSWTGVSYTTRDGSRRAFESPEELLATIAELAGWPGPEAPTLSSDTTDSG